MQCKKTEEPNELVSTLQKLIHTSQYKHTKKKHYDTENNTNTSL